MRHGALYLIIRDVNLLNHRAVNDWMSLIKGSFRCLRICAATVTSFRSEAFFSFQESRLTMLAEIYLCGLYARNVACYPPPFPIPGLDPVI